MAQSVLDEHQIEVDSLHVRVATSGIETRQIGEPVIVLVSGAATPLENWNSIASAAAEIAPVVAYDRPGIGGSEPAPDSPDPTWVASHLDRLLDALDVEPPYLLVGHSWGGVLVKYFASIFPDDVAGMLLIDPTDATLTRSRNITIFESFGAGEAEYAAFQSIIDEMASRAPPSVASEMAAIRAFENDQGRGQPELPTVATTILLAGKPNPPPPGIELPFDFNRYFSAMLIDRIQSFSRETLALPKGTMVLDSGAGHFIHSDNPQLVVDAISRLFADSTSQEK